MRTLLLAVLGAVALVEPAGRGGSSPSLLSTLRRFRLWLRYSPYPYYSPVVRADISASASASTAARPTPPARAAEREQQRALKLYVYPAAGQSEAQTSEDRYQCHVWAADQSGHDPTLGAGSRDDAESYTRAFTACMEGRNYVVK